ncbi:hypothetical protein [Tepidibacter hydrothermalis]|uniref:Uncharacterized protein n=1 Tax=Tepidibacter hydrothermalis TaxID=3036126 RepID=A0ABY8EB77_9FIRM|nr:hypothetical protein [Tepidibacter hydrothermalis]WFD10172.1 hypothetical protein P4S50_17715 [Tepidibacter hydrothermalis]
MTTRRNLTLLCLLIFLSTIFSINLYISNVNLKNEIISNYSHKLNITQDTLFEVITLIDVYGNLRGNSLIKYKYIMSHLYLSLENDDNLSNIANDILDINKYMNTANIDSGLSDDAINKIKSTHKKILSIQNKIDSKYKSDSVLKDNYSFVN